MEKKQIEAYEFRDHGYEHSQYFQGCSTYGTPYDYVATGAGLSRHEAIDQALEIAAMDGYNVDPCEKSRRGKGHQAWGNDYKVPMAYRKDEYNEVYWYISIMIKTTEKESA